MAYGVLKELVAHSRAKFDEALQKGHSYSWEQRWDEAIQQFLLAVREMPAEPAAYTGLALAYTETGQLNKALENYKLAARYTQGDVVYLRPVADLQQRLGQLAEAGQTYLAMGEMQLKNHALREAIESWQQATRLAPNLLGPHQRLAAVYQKQGNGRAAGREYVAIARILAGRGESERARQTLRVAQQIYPQNGEVARAIELIEQGRPLEMAAVEPVGAEWGESGPTAQPPADQGPFGPLAEARRLAVEQLAGRFFDEAGPSANTHLSQALHAQAHGQPAEAIQSYEQAMAAGEDSPAAHLSLGLLYHDQGRFAEASDHLEAALAEPAFQLAGRLALAAAQWAQDNRPPAIRSFCQALQSAELAAGGTERAAQVQEAYQQLADRLLTAAASEQAETFGRAVLAFFGRPDWPARLHEARQRLDALADAGGPVALGDVLTTGSDRVLEPLYLIHRYSRQGLLEAAVEEAYRAIQLAPRYLPAHWQLGELLAQQGHSEAAALKFTAIGDTCRARDDLDGAISSYERVAELSPFNLPARATLIDLLRQAGQVDRALEQYLIWGDAHYQMAQADEARQAYQNAYQLAARSSDPQGWQARLLLLIGDLDLQRLDWKRALLAYRELRRQQPEDGRIALRLVDLYDKVGQPEQAGRELDSYLLQLIRGGRSDLVTGILEDLVEERPADSGLVERLARLYWQQNRPQAAVALLERLSQAQIEAGDRAQARVTLERIIQLRPPNLARYQATLRQLQ